MNLQGHKHDASKSRPLYVCIALSMVCVSSAGVWPSCQVKTGVSVLVLVIMSGFSKSSDIWVSINLII